jgi:hypothetical protein
MTEKREEGIFQLGLTQVGAHFLKRNDKLAKWLFAFSLALSVLMLMNYFLLMIMYRANLLNQNAGHSIFYALEVKWVPLLNIIQVFLFVYGSLSYFRFARQSVNSLDEVNVESFNMSFKYIFRTTMLSFLQAGIAIFNYSVMIIFIFKRITHNA